MDIILLVKSRKLPLLQLLQKEGCRTELPRRRCAEEVCPWVEKVLQTDRERERETPTQSPTRGGVVLASRV